MHIVSMIIYRVDVYQSRPIGTSLLCLGGHGLHCSSNNLKTSLTPNNHHNHRYHLNDHYPGEPICLQVLWRYCLGGRKGIRPIKIEWWGAGAVICLGQGADLHMAQLMPPAVSCFSKIQIDFTIPVPAHPDSPWKRAIKRVLLWYPVKILTT